MKPYFALNNEGYNAAVKYLKQTEYASKIDQLDGYSLVHLANTLKEKEDGRPT